MQLTNWALCSKCLPVHESKWYLCELFVNASQVCLRDVLRNIDYLSEAKMKACWNFLDYQVQMKVYFMLSLSETIQNMTLFALVWTTIVMKRKSEKICSTMSWLCPIINKPNLTHSEILLSSGFEITTSQSKTSTLDQITIDDWPCDPDV